MLTWYFEFITNLLSDDDEFVINSKYTSTSLSPLLSQILSSRSWTCFSEYVSCYILAMYLTTMLLDDFLPEANFICLTWMVMWSHIQWKSGISLQYLIFFYQTNMFNLIYSRLIRLRKHSPYNLNQVFKCLYRVYKKTQH